MAMQGEPQKLPEISRNLFIILLLLIVGGAVIRSALATRLDGFTIDEAYRGGAKYEHNDASDSPSDKSVTSDLSANRKSSG